MLGLILLFLLLILLFGVGFSVHLLWILALVVLALILVSFATRSGGRRGNWW